MNVKTGYFAYTAKYQQMGYTCISIARFKPKWFNGLSLEELSPPYVLIKSLKSGIITEDEFTNAYISMLDKLDIDGVFDKIKYFINKEQSKGVVLLCYEKFGDFCHRHILAKYLNTRYNLSIEELKILL